MSVYNPYTTVASPPDKYNYQRGLDIMKAESQQWVDQITYTLQNHADAIRHLQSELGATKDILDWVADTYPHVLKEYKAVKDIQEASNAR